MTAALAQAWAHGPGKLVLAERPRPPVPEPRADGTSWSKLPNGIAAVLRAALGPLSWDPWTRHNDHRAYPSVRPVRAHHVWLVEDARRWRLDPVRELLVGPGQPALHSTTRLAIEPAPGRLPAGYGELRTALALLEVGHVVAALLSAAAAAGRQAVAETDGATARVAIPDGAWAGAIRRPCRSSGVDPCGLAVDPRPLPGAALAALVDTAGHPPAGSITTSLVHRAAVHAVSGLPDGAYLAVGGELRAHRPGPASRQIAAASRTPAAQLDAGAGNVAWAITADVAAAVRTGGESAYPRLLMATGCAAQQLCEAAARHGLFCRPLRAVEEPELEAALGCPPGEDVLYLLVAGRARAIGPRYDLTAADPV